MDKFLICGLGNPGAEYDGTRHNTGFMAIDTFAKAMGVTFQDKRYGFVAEASVKGRKIFLLKPTTFMNLSGNAVRYWLNEERMEATVATMALDISCSLSGKIMHDYALVLVTTIHEEHRLTGFWDTIRTMI